MVFDITICLLIGIPVVILVFATFGWLWFLGKIFTWILAGAAAVAAIAFVVLAGGAFLWYCWPVVVVILAIFIIRKIAKK